MEVESISFQEQFHILVDMLRDPHGKPYSMATLAKAANISDQSLSYLLEGRSQYPRLETLRGICRFFHISIDYFHCDTVSECRTYLLARLSESSTLLNDIASEAAALTQRGQRNVVTVLEWLRNVKKNAHPKQNHDAQTEIGKKP